MAEHRLHEDHIAARQGEQAAGGDAPGFEQRLNNRINWCKRRRRTGFLRHFNSQDGVLIDYNIGEVGIENRFFVRLEQSTRVIPDGWRIACIRISRARGMGNRVSKSFK